MSTEDIQVTYNKLPEKSHDPTNYIHFSITIVVITWTACAYYILNTIHITHCMLD